MKKKYWLMKTIKPKFDYIREEYGSLNPFFKWLTWISGILILGFFIFFGYNSMRFQY